MPDEVDYSVVLVCHDQRLGRKGWPFSSLPDLVVRAVITSSPPASISSAGMLSTPVDFTFFYCGLHVFAKDGMVVLGVCLGTVQY